MNIENEVIKMLASYIDIDSIDQDMNTALKRYEKILKYTIKCYRTNRSDMTTYQIKLK